MKREEKWRLILGKQAENPSEPTPLEGMAQGMDNALDALYEQPNDKKGGLGASSPRVHRWLGDIRQYFPKSVVQLLQKDAFERLGLKQMLLEPETLETLEMDIHLAATILSLNKVMPQQTRETARIVVRKVVDELLKRLQHPLRQAITGALSRSVRNRRPRPHEIDWKTTIRYNLKHYQPDYQTIVPHQLIGSGRRGQQLRDIILCVDQSGSMAASVVYSGILGAVMASIPAVRTRMVVFDTTVIDLTEQLHDPIELLFCTQLGGGTDINQALAYCERHIQRPNDTILILISDMYEGGNEEEMFARVTSLQTAGVQFITLLALSDQGSVGFDARNANRLKALGIPAFACTPDAFPSLMATAINKGDIYRWLDEQGITAKG